MKRIAKRINLPISAEKEAELDRVRETIDREEKAEILEKARRVRAQHAAAQAELSRAAEVLKAERIAQGLSLADMQSRTGISRAALCRLENLVDANPTVATLERIATALGKQLVIGLQERP